MGGNGPGVACTLRFDFDPALGAMFISSAVTAATSLIASTEKAVR